MFCQIEGFSFLISGSQHNPSAAFTSQLYAAMPNCSKLRFILSFYAIFYPVRLHFPWVIHHRHRCRWYAEKSNAFRNMYSAACRSFDRSLNYLSQKSTQLNSQSGYQSIKLDVTFKDALLPDAILFKPFPEITHFAT